MIKSAEKIILDIIKNELDLDYEYGKTSDKKSIPCLVERNQDFNLQTIDKLQIIVGVNNSKVLAVNSYLNTDTEQEIKSVNLWQEMQIDMISKNNEARDRNWEVLTALNSIYSVQQQELYQFKIFKIPTSFVNTSEAEGSNFLKRYTLTFFINIWYNKTKKDTAQIFDSFKTEIQTEDDNQEFDIQGGN